MEMNYIAQNIQIIKDKIAAVSDSCGRSAGEITLLAITKTFPVDKINQAAEAGLRRFGENRIQEAEQKIPLMDPGSEWHLVGHLQTNKARRAAELFNVIQSIDSIKIASRLNQACLEIDKTLSILLQVDLAGEETKYGAPPSEIPGIIEACREFTALRIDGLMTVPPYFPNPEQARPYFSRLRELGERLEMEHSGCLGRRHLSMGMSHDFEEAIREGATILRIGTAIFGIRQ
jgi:PLP dependent protein